MKANRLTIIAALLIAFCSAATAQRRVDIVLKNKSMMSCTLDDIEYMEIVECAREGEIDGVWFLGWKVTSSATTNVGGAEMLVFTAGRMKWLKTSSEVTYSVAYDENGPLPGTVIQAQRSTGTNYKYTIWANDGEVLVLKQGTTRYYFYKTKQDAIAARKPESSNYLGRQQYATKEALWNSNLKGGNTHSTVSPMGSRIGNYPAATDEDKEWLANPNNQPDQAWHDLSGNNWVAKTITLYPMDSSPVPADVNQHGIGNCCMCAVFASFAYIYPEWIKSIIEKNGNNYTVHMFDPKGNPIDVVVDNKLLCNSSGGVIQVYGKNNKYNWATIMEKALMKWETRFQCNKIGGIGTEHAAPPFTGNGDSYSFSPGDKYYNAEYSLIVDYAISNGMIGVGGFNVGDVQMGDLNTVTGHAFTVMYPDEGSDYLFVMRNPWGNEPEGSSAANRTDGKLKIPNEHEKLRIIDFRLVYPGEQMAQYKRENISGYAPPRFVATYHDMNPTEEMLRMYGVKDYVPVYPVEEDETPALEQ